MGASRFRRPPADARSLTACEAGIVSHRLGVASTRASRVESGPRQRCSGCSCKLLVPLGRAQRKPEAAKGSNTPHEYHLPPHEQHMARGEYHLAPGTAPDFRRACPGGNHNCPATSQKHNRFCSPPRLVRVEATIPWRNPPFSETACTVALRCAGRSGFMTAWAGRPAGAKWCRIGA